MKRTLVTMAAVVSVLAAASGTAWAATISTFTGGDAGEGLDLVGTFPYAIEFNWMQEGQSANQGGGAVTFGYPWPSGHVPGTTVTIASGGINGAHTPNYGC